MADVKRPSGRGSVDPIVDPETGEVRYRARLPLQPDGSRPSLGEYATYKEAEAALDTGWHELRESRRTGTKTFAEFAADVLDEREHNGIRGIGQERGRFAKHVATACFAGKAIDQVRPADIAEWLRAMGRKRADDRRGDRPLSASAIARCLSLASAIFDEAGPQGRGVVASNPCIGMKVKKKESEKATEEVWTFLTEEEQEAVRTSISLSEADRLAILFAVGTGLRQGEQFNLELRDLHVDGPEPHVFVRFGSKGKAPKNGKPRRVPLFGIGLEAARAWLRILPSFCVHNFDKLVFPTMNGHRRGQKPLGNGRFIEAANGTHVIRSGKPRRSAKGTHVYVDRFELAMRAIGVERNVRWHDLRHTCASSLVGGFWGDAWTLEEVKEMLGHSSIMVTQRYAHLGETALKKAARKVRWISFSSDSTAPANAGSGSDQRTRTATASSLLSSTSEFERTGLPLSGSLVPSPMGSSFSTDATTLGAAGRSISTSGATGETCTTAASADGMRSALETGEPSSPTQQRPRPSPSCAPGPPITTSLSATGSTTGQSALSPQAKPGATSVASVGTPLVGGGPGGGLGVAAIYNDSEEVGRPRVELGTYGLKGRPLTETLRQLASENGASDQLATNLANTFATLLESASGRHPAAHQRPADDAGPLDDGNGLEMHRSTLQ